MVKHLSRMSDEVENGKKIIAIREVLKHDNKVTSKTLEKPLELTSRQVAFFLKRIDEIERKKEGGRYVYSVSEEVIGERIEYGVAWIDIGRKFVKTYLGDEFEVNVK